ncbi:MAG: type I restriction-modification system subunit M [Planctomycetia bacterium]|nr:type I restriction-modification system subunit M [Planctomycetia bacterium]
MGTTIEKIKSVLWAGADTFRGVIDAANYKEYILTMLFIKYLDDTYEENVDELRKKYPNDLRFERAKERLSFQLEDNTRFRHLYDNRFNTKIGVLINEALQKIEDLNGELRGIFRSIDFNSEAVFGNTQQKNTRLRTLLEDFVDLDLKPSHIEIKPGQTAADVIGDAYEYMIGEFASRAGQKAGAFFTPTMVSELMGHLVEPQKNNTIYDPTCGSASLLIRAAEQLDDLDHVGIYGQEVNGSTYAMARMNLFIHNIHGADIRWGDSLANPLHLDSDGNLKQFDVIVANMPFSLDKWAEGFNPGGESDGRQDVKKGKKFKMEPSLDRFHRFEIGVPPASKGDWAFLLHMLASLNNYGRMAAVVPHGVLFRGASEGRIRQAVIERNLLDTVIGLPPNLFYGTSIPACILVFKKNRTTDDILFIDASGQDENGNLRYEKDKNQNKLGSQHVTDIVDAYRNRRDVPRFSHVAPLSEIQENEYNLNIPRYVDTFEPEELINIDEVQANIARIKNELAEVEEQMEGFLKKLGL